MTSTTQTPTPSGTAAEASGSRSAERSWWTFAASVMLLATIGWGTLQLVSLVAREQWTEVIGVPTAIDTVEVSVQHGSVRIVTSERATPVVTGRISRGLWPVDRSVEVVDHRLVVSAQCRGIETTWCSTDYDIEVPVGTRVSVRSGHGQVRVDGEPGIVEASSGHGNVAVVGRPASVDARTGHGSVRVEGVGQVSVTARSGHGGVRVIAVEPPLSVLARSGHGRVEVVVPESDESYRVELVTGQGDTTNAVRSDPSAARSIELRSGHGDVEVRYPP